MSESTVTGVPDDFASADAVVRGSVETAWAIGELTAVLTWADAVVGASAIPGNAKLKTVARERLARLPLVD